MENKDKIEIPFGTKDSELYECEYTIPEGYEAEIKDGKVIIRKKESEDEKIRKEMIEILKKEARDFPSSVIANKSNSWIAWLEKRGEQKPAAWKPSDKQMTALRRMKAAVGGEGEIYEPLNSLYEDLKKLREE